MSRRIAQNDLENLCKMSFVGDVQAECYEIEVGRFNSVCFVRTLRERGTSR
jgi:hypothetical protein